MSKNKEKYKQSDTVTIKRSQINFAPYNPKQHSKEQINALKKNIKRVGFLGGIIWNSVSGNLVDGHKRIMAFDLIHNYDGSVENDYPVKVEKCELDEKAEKEQNIFQTKSRTELDNELLATIIQEDISIEYAGLTEEDIHMIEVEVPDFDFGANIEADADFKQLNKERKERSETDRLQNIAKVKEAKQAARNKSEGGRFLTLTFDSFDSKAQFLDSLGFDSNTEYLSGEEFDEKIQDING